MLKVHQLSIIKKDLKNKAHEGFQDLSKEENEKSKSTATKNKEIFLKKKKKMSNVDGSNIKIS